VQPRKPAYPFDSEDLSDLRGWFSRVSGRTHMAYFSRQEVME
jgi:hypothetical protein